MRNNIDLEESPSARRRSYQRGVSLATWSRLSPHRLAIRSTKGNRTFSELDTNCNRLARALADRGVRVDDGLALICANRPEFVEVMFAAERAGIRVTPIPSDSTPREVEYMIDDSGATAIIADATVSPGVAHLASQRAGMKARLSIGAETSALESYHSALNSADAHPFEAGTMGIPMLYTSSTTGSPKGVYRREPVSRSAMVTLAEQLRLSSKYDKALAPLPLGRVFNLSVRLPLVSGVEVLLSEELDPNRLLDLIAQNGITYAYLTPFLLHRLAQLPVSARKNYDLRSLRNVLHTGAPCAVPLKRQMIEWLGPIITECYAGTEGGDVVISSEDWLRKPGSVGKADDRVVILDEDGKTLPPNTIGRIFLTAPERGRFEYFNEPEKTRAAYYEDRFTMGDHGYLDQDGYLFLTGRSTEIINSGGLKIYPAEIEAVLLTHSCVEDAACIGVPDAEMGEKVKALIKLLPERRSEDGLSVGIKHHCSEHLAPYKGPSEFEFVEEIPRLPSGKLLRDLLRQRYC